MSRPFSYNDENFTVIGNVLFCHIEIKERIINGSPIVEIPPEIYARMLFTYQRLTEVGHALRVTSPSVVDVGVKNRGQKILYVL